MKEKLKNIGCCLLLIPFLPWFILTILIVILYDFIATPFRKAKYKKSHFYRDFQEKFNSDFYTSDSYEIYNAVRAANLPIVATPYRENGTINDLLFTYQDTLLYISPIWFMDYDKEKDKWECEVFNEEKDENELVDFNEYIAQEIKSEIPLLPDLPDTHKTVILLRKDRISKESLPYALQSEHFLIYDKKDIAASLEQFVTMQ